MKAQKGRTPVHNLYAAIGKKDDSRDDSHLCFAGHVDVVPTGDPKLWTAPPFSGKIIDNELYGRGAVDMKGGVAAFVAAVDQFLKERKNKKGRISLIITNDEEAQAFYGTQNILKRLKERGDLPDVCVVGEPTNPNYIGQAMKIGRRGSLTARFTYIGSQGHVAYPHMATSAVTGLCAIIRRLTEMKLLDNSEYFDPTTIAPTTFDIGNDAVNIIPGRGKATVNCRYSDDYTAETLKEVIQAVVDEELKKQAAISDPKNPPRCEIEFSNSAKCFITKPGKWTETVRQSILEATGHEPEYSTSGGTSDARYIFEYGIKVVEFGLCNGTIHAVDERTALEDLEFLTKSYYRTMCNHFDY